MGFKLIEHILQHVFSSVKVGVLLMKIWKWYKNLSDEEFIASKNLSIEDKYPLYAFTNKKKYAKQFKKMRRMERFIEVHDNLTRAEYTEFCNNKNKQMLKMYPYTYFDKKKYGIPLEIKILTTGDEKDTTGAALDDIFDSDSMQGMMVYEFNPFVLNIEYLNALNKLEFINLWKMYTAQHIDYRVAEELGFQLDYSYPEITYDEVVGFITIYGDTFKDGQEGAEYW